MHLLLVLAGVLGSIFAIHDSLRYGFNLEMAALKYFSGAGSVVVAYLAASLVERIFVGATRR